jgi:16S rRNA (guanine966-N2)-methyltransferase
MRVTGGKFRGRKITPPPKGISGVRPSMDMVREAVFSMLQHLIDFNGIRVLDLYSGSGAYGFESVSRGAAEVYFVEKRKDCIHSITTTAKYLGVNTSVCIRHGSVESFPGRRETGKFNLVFADPPYLSVSLSEFLSHIRKSNILADKGIIVYECEAREFESIYEYMDQIKSEGVILKSIKKYSKTCIAILENEQ